MKIKILLKVTFLYGKQIIKYKKLMLNRKKILERASDDDDYVIYTDPNRRKRATKKYVASGAWSLKENEIYLDFLQSQHELFETQFIRRSSKVFRKMSSLLRRRDPEQCRSHHQKLGIRFDGDILKIIDYLKRKIGKSTKIMVQPDIIANDNEKKFKESKLKTRSPGQSPKDEEIYHYKTTCSEKGFISIIICLDDVQSW